MRPATSARLRSSCCLMLLAVSLTDKGRERERVNLNMFAHTGNDRSIYPHARSRARGHMHTEFIKMFKE